MEQTQIDRPQIVVSKGRRRLYFLLLYALFMADFIARLGVNSILPLIQKDLNLTDVQIGSLASIVLLSMAVFVLPISFYGERTSRKYAITLSALVWGIGSLLSGMASNFSLLFASRFAVGLGNSAYAPLSNSLLTSMYEKSKWGKKIGLYNTAMTFGGAIGAIYFAKLAEISSWRMAFYIIGAFSIVLALSSLSLPNSKEKQNEMKAKVNFKDTKEMILKNKALLFMSFGAGVGIFVIQAVGAWTSIYFVRELGYSVMDSAKLIGLSAILAAAGFPLGGIILDKWYQKDKRSRLYLPMITFALTALSFVTGFYLKNIVFIIGAQVLYVFAVTAFHAATQELVPTWFKSVSYGVYVLFIQFLGALGPLFAGIFSEAFGLTSSLLLLQGFWVLAILLLWYASCHYFSSYDKARSLEEA